jgi:ABC-type multidrug transport system ATPase subunit
MSAPVISIQKLSKKFKRRWAVKDLDMEVREGDIFGFLGPNGAGKSTTIRMALSLIRPTEGDVSLFGHSLRSERQLALRDVGGIVEKPDFYLYLSAKRNLDIVGALAGGVGRTRIDEVLDMVGLRDRGGDPVKTYSHGMKQRLGIAQALLTDPRLIILDEPTNGLDPHGMKEIRDLIHALSRDHEKTIFLSSHLLNEVEQVATRMAIINEGTLVVQGNVKELLSGDEMFVHLEAEPVRSVLSVCKKASDIVRTVSREDGGFRVSISTKNIPLLLKKFHAARVKVYAITPKRSLEEYFLSITKQGEIV